MVGGRHTLLEKYLGSYYKEEYALISGTFENVSILLVASLYCDKNKENLDKFNKAFLPAVLQIMMMVPNT